MKKIRGKQILIITAVVIILGAGIFMVWRSQIPKEKAVIELTLEDSVMKQGEPLPEQKAKVTLTGDEKIMLDRKENYQVKDLVMDLKKGKFYTADPKTDGKTKGEFDVEIKGDKTIREKLEKKWARKVEVHFKKGKLKVERSVMKDKPMIALTFDDGPGPDTGKILDVLEKYDERATFFMLGRAVNTYPETVKRIYETGNELANHSTTHADLSKSSVEKIRYEIDTATAAIANATGGQKPSLLRPPYGAVNSTVRANAGMPLILWSVDTLDWKTRDTQNTIKVVMDSAEDGAIILMHDIHAPSVEAAVQIIPKLVEKGYQLVTVSELAQAKGITMENGKKYFNFHEN